jgi:hypothetical protein
VEKRIKFAPGKSSATLGGTIGQPKVNRVGEVRDRYLLGARKGQKLTVRVSGTRPVLVAVWHDDYNEGWLGSKTGAQTTQSYTLPKSGDYYVDVETAEHVKASDYRLTVEIR